jgi:putative salt-induced outer membrane protein YdiY
LIGMVFGMKCTSHTIFLSLLLSIVSFVAPSSHAATITLENGDRVTGKLLRLTDNTLTLKSPIFGEVSIPWKQVRSMESEDEVQVQLQDGTRATAKLKIEEDGRMQIDAGGDASPRVLSRHDLAALNPPVINPEYTYSGRLNFGGTFNRGNSSSDQYNLAGELVARRPADRYTFGVELNEASSDGIQTVSDRRLNAQYDAFLRDKNFLFLNTKFTQDEQAALDLRTSLGAGYGYQFLDSDIVKLSGQVGLNYVHENYTDMEDETFPTLSIGFKYDRKLLNKKLVYFQNLETDINLKDTRDILTRATVGIGLPVAKNLTVNTQLNVNYDHQPAAGTDKSDTALIFSVGYGF